MFEVHLSRFSKIAVDKFKSLSGCIFLPTKRDWSIPAQHKKNIEKFFKENAQFTNINLK
jgi:hypothetical protein